MRETFASRLTLRVRQVLLRPDHLRGPTILGGPPVGDACAHAPGGLLEEMRLGLTTERMFELTYATFLFPAVRSLRHK